MYQCLNVLVCFAGKIHLIEAIQYETIRLLPITCNHPEDTCVLLTAPTGIAAYSLYAETIHNTFSMQQIFTYLTHL